MLVDESIDSALDGNSVLVDRSTNSGFNDSDIGFVLID